MIKLYQLLSKLVCLSVLLLTCLSSGIYAVSADPIDDLAISDDALCGTGLTFVYNTEPLSSNIDSTESYNVCVPTASLAVIQDAIDDIQESISNEQAKLLDLPSDCPSQKDGLVEKHELTKFCFSMPLEGSIIFAVKIFHDYKKVIVHWLNKNDCPSGNLSEKGTYCEFEKGEQSFMSTSNDKFKITKPKIFKSVKVSSWLMPEYTTNNRTGESHTLYRIARGNFKCASTELTGNAPRSKLTTLTKVDSTTRLHRENLDLSNDFKQAQSSAQTRSTFDEIVSYCGPGIPFPIIDKVLPINAFEPYPDGLDGGSFM